MGIVGRSGVQMGKLHNVVFALDVLSDATVCSFSLINEGDVNPQSSRRRDNLGQHRLAAWSPVDP
jgi:hypothetical protein